LDDSISKQKNSYYIKIYKNDSLVYNKRNK
jgi:hypothetical protein